MPKTPSTAVLDKALVAIAGLACKSAKLSPAEKPELKALVAKGAKAGKFNMTDRARCIWLIRKAAPENIPNVRVPDRVKRVLGLGNGHDESLPPPTRERPLTDPLDRLEKLGELRGRPLTDSQFAGQRERVLADPLMSSFGSDEKVDPLDRLTKVARLEEAGILTADQAARVTEQILNAT